MTENHKKTILIIDDIAENIDILREILSGYNHKVAISGKIAIKVAEKTHPDLILLDVMMPEMNGFEVATKLKNNPDTCNIPIIFVTAKVENLTILKELNIKEEDYIIKPFEPKEIVERVISKIGSC